MSIASMIDQHAADEFAAGDDAAVVAAVNAATTVDSAAWTYSEIGRTLGSAVRATVNSTMLGIARGQLALPSGYEALAADIDSARIALSTGGMTLHEAETQGLIDILASVGGWSAELTASVKRLGRPLHTVQILGRELTADDVAAERLRRAGITAAQRGNDAVNAAVAAAEDGQDAAAQRAALIDAWDAGGE